MTFDKSFALSLCKIAEDFDSRREPGECHCAEAIMAAVLRQAIEEIERLEAQICN